MAIRMRVSPDPDGIVRLRCGEVELELEIGPPSAGSSGQPTNVEPTPIKPMPIQPVDWTSPGPFRQRAFTTIDVKPGAMDIEKIVSEALKKFDAKEIEDLDVVRLKTDVLDVHQLGDLAVDMGKTYGRSAPKLFVDLQTPSGVMKIK